MKKKHITASSHSNHDNYTTYPEHSTQQPPSEINLHPWNDIRREPLENLEKLAAMEETVNNIKPPEDDPFLKDFEDFPNTGKKARYHGGNYE